MKEDITLGQPIPAKIRALAGTVRCKAAPTDKGQCYGLDQCDDYPDNCDGLGNMKHERIPNVKPDKAPGCLEGLQAIKDWLDEVYPADIFGGETDIMTAVCQDAYHELNPGVRAVIAMRWAINIGMCGKTAEPAIFISRRSED